jgi:hypothetical protein
MMQTGVHQDGAHSIYTVRLMQVSEYDAVHRIEYYCRMTRKPDDGNNLLPYIAAALAGLMICMAISLATGRREAWDAGAYYSVGIPIMVLLIFAIAWVFPDRPWRWTLAMAAGQSLSAFLQGSSLSLFPIAIVFMMVISVPQFISGYLAARWSRSRDAAGA